MNDRPMMMYDVLLASPLLVSKFEDGHNPYFSQTINSLYPLLKYNRELGSETTKAKRQELETRLIEFGIISQ